MNLQHAAEISQGKRFEFGANWSRFLNVLNNERIDQAAESLRKMLGVDHLQGKRFLDAGSGSGLFSLAARRLGAQVPSASVDFCFSNAVLEHIPKGDFDKLADELLRVLKPNGVCVHRVDLKDHLGGGLNNLRFTEARWEGALFRNSGFYTNRIRFGEMVASFEAAGFECRLPRIVRWEKLPLSRLALDASFRQLPDEDLLVSGFDIVLRCAA